MSARRKKKKKKKRESFCEKKLEMEKVEFVSKKATTTTLFAVWNLLVKNNRDVTRWKEKFKNTRDVIWWRIKSDFSNEGQSSALSWPFFLLHWLLSPFSQVRSILHFYSIWKCARLHYCRSNYLRVLGGQPGIDSTTLIYFTQGSIRTRYIHSIPDTLSSTNFRFRFKYLRV